MPNEDKSVPQVRCGNCGNSRDFGHGDCPHCLEVKQQAGHHPAYYNNHPSGVECITIAKEMNFCLGSAVKYIWRAGQKDGQSALVDLDKARFMITQEIQRLGGE